MKRFLSLFARKPVWQSAQSVRAIIDLIDRAFHLEMAEDEYRALQGLSTTEILTVYHLLNRLSQRSVRPYR